MTQTTRKARLVITFGPSDPATDPCLDAIARLAGRSRRLLVAHCVDNAALLAAAGLPFTRTVGRFGETSALDPGATVRAINTMRTRWRQRLEQLAALHDIQWTFAETPPQPDDELTEDDLLSGVASPGADWTRFRGRPVVALVRSNGHGILLVYSGNPRSLDITGELATDLALPVEVALACDDQEADTRCRREVEAWRETLPDKRLVRSITPVRTIPFAELVRRYRPRVVIVDRLALMNTAK